MGKKAMGKKPNWKRISVGDETLQFASQAGFVSLDIVEDATFGDGITSLGGELSAEELASFRPLEEIEAEHPWDADEVGGEVEVVREGVGKRAPTGDKDASKQPSKKQKKMRAKDTEAKLPAEEKPPAVDRPEVAAVEGETRAQRKRREKKALKQANRAAAAVTESAAPTAVPTAVRAAVPAVAVGKSTFSAVDSGAAVLQVKKKSKRGASVAEEVAAEAMVVEEPNDASGVALRKKERRRAEAQVSAEAPVEAETEEEGEVAGDVQGDHAMADVSSWEAFGLHRDILAALSARGFSTPTPIQREVLPVAIHGRRDVVGAAETGSGKTLAFGLPILQELLNFSDFGVALEGLFALIVAPTRELAAQVCEHLKAVCPPSHRRAIVSLVGGMSIEKQKRQLQHRPAVVVGTPGRLWELAQDPSGSYLRKLESLRFFVLDEVDRMVETGHFKELENLIQLIERENGDEEGAAEAADDADGDAADEGGDEGEGEGEGESEIEGEDDGAGAGRGVAVRSGDAAAVNGGGAGVNSLGKQRQTFLFSATLMLPPNARESNAKNIKKHKATSTDTTMERLLTKVAFKQKLKVVDLSRPEKVAGKLEQTVITCMHNEKDLYLFLLLRNRPGRSIIFCNAITALQRLRSLLDFVGITVIALQGAMQQRARLKALDRFKEQPSAVLLATDVAARGLDISGVDYVVHFQLPRSAEVYVHRSGRTARAAASGLSIAMVEPSEQKDYRRLCFDIGVPDGLAEYRIDPKQVAKAREVVSLARQVDKATHVAKRQTENARFRKQLAQEMELPSESDDDEPDPTATRIENREKRELMQKKERLAQLLKTLERPSSMTIDKVDKAVKQGVKW